MNLNELRDRAYKTACEHGWHDEKYSNEHFLCLVISELMEAVEADRKRMHAFRTPFEDFICRFTTDPDHAYKVAFDEYIKDSVEDELSDAVIRLLDLAGLRQYDLSATYDFVDDLGSLKQDVMFSEICYVLTGIITEEQNRVETKICAVLASIIRYCQEKGIEIDWFIQQKMKYNELRPYKHGNKNY